MNTDLKIDINIASELERRISKRIDLVRLHKLCGVDYVAAGGCMLAAKPNDYDLYAERKDIPFNLTQIQTRCVEEHWTTVAVTKNAITMRDPDGKIFQFCQYAKDSVQELVKSFDFAHCQVGVAVRTPIPTVADVSVEAVYTPNFIRAMAVQKTFFCGTEYPLSSLIRLVKYAKRGLYGKGRGYMGDVVKILAAVIDRGYDDYADFKDQLDAIDLSFDEHGAYELWVAISNRFKHD